MKCLFCFVCLVCFLFSHESEHLDWHAPLLIDETKNASKAIQIVNFVEQAICLAEECKSNLDNVEVLSLEGMSSVKVRHLLNNLCNWSGARYLEVGVWKGSTFISALYNNQDNLGEAIAIDNWSQFGEQKDCFIENCNNFLKNKYVLLSEDAFSLDITTIEKPVDIYFYDGDHSEHSQKMAFTYFDRIFNDTFVVLVDDWNWDEVKKGTREAFEELGYNILYSRELPARFNGDKENWWHGLYIAVVQKTKGFS